MSKVTEQVSELQHAYWTGQITRHELLRRAAKLGMSAAALASLPTMGVTRALAEGRQLAFAKSPITFVWADYEEPSSLDPAIVSDTASFCATRNVYEAL